MSETTPERPHRTGLFWLDFVVAVSAIVISGVSLFLALRSDHIQERLLAANAWPDLEFHSGNFEQNKRQITLTFRNAGVGPARVRWVTIEYAGRTFVHSSEILAACCDHTHALTATLVTDHVPRSVLVPHESVAFVTVSPNAADADAYKRFDHERHKLHVRACFCSILDECWLLDNAKPDEDSAPVKNCNPEPAGAFLE